MATMTLIRPRSPDTLQHRLLSLDCSADLQSYSRNLGPGVQEKTFQRTSDALRAQLEEHRDFLLRHQQNEHAQLTPVSQVNSPVAPSVQVMPPAQHATPLLRDVGQPRHYIQPPQPQFPQALVPLWPPAPKAPTPVPGSIETYPPALREALEQCSRQSAAIPDDATLYHVVYHLSSAYMDDESEVVETYRSPWAASTKVAEYFVDNFLGDGDDFEAHYELSSSGTLSCKIETDGSQGGIVTVFVKQGRTRG